MDVGKEIKDRLKLISKLLKEVEDILCKHLYNKQLPKDQSYICICEQESSSEILSNDNHIMNRNGINVQTKKHLNTTCSEKHVKSEELDKYKNSADVNETIGRRSWKTYKHNREKDKDLDEVSCVLCCEMSNKPIDKIEKNCNREYYINKLNDIKEMFLSYFEEFNKD